jgi:hypothetical protein
MTLGTIPPNALRVVWFTFHFQPTSIYFLSLVLDIFNRHQMVEYPTCLLFLYSSIGIACLAIHFDPVPDG